MPLRGELSDLPLMDLLQILLMNRRTGVLIVEREHLSLEEGIGDRGNIFLREGQVKFIYLRRGKQLSDVLSVMGYPMPALKAGEATELNTLIEILESDNPRKVEVARHAKRLTEERMGELLRWNSGRFLFKDMDVPETLNLLELDSLELLVQGARHIDEWEWISSKLPSFEVVPQYTKSLPDGPLSFTPSEWKVLASVDGNRSVREIADQFPESTFEVAKAVVSLIEKGVIEVTERETPPQDVFPVVHRLLLMAYERFEMEDFEQAEDIAAKALALDPTLSVAHLFLGEVYYAQGKYKEAVRRYLEAARRDPSLSPRINYHVACALVMSGDFEMAMGCLDEVSSLNAHPKAKELKRLLESLFAFLKAKERSFEE